MRTKRISTVVLALALLLAVTSGSLAQEPRADPAKADGLPDAPQAAVTSAFTYQGLLNKSGSPASGNCDFQFGLWAAASGGSRVGSTLTKTNVAVSKGTFTVELDFGEAVFLTGAARWLQIAVRCPTGSGSYTTLTPRQTLTAAPYALYPRGVWNFFRRDGFIAGRHATGQWPWVDDLRG